MSRPLKIFEDAEKSQKNARKCQIPEISENEQYINMLFRNSRENLKCWNCQKYRKMRKTSSVRKYQIMSFQKMCNTSIILTTLKISENKNSGKCDSKNL